MPESRSELELTLQRRVRQRLAQLLDELTAGLVERDVAVRLALLAAVAGEHVILVGPPGTAKSQIARRVASVFADGRYFERLMTRFSVPEELFGPLSLAALERDVYTRLVDGYLPTASIAFLDEVFKANSAILNSLLGVLNERTFDNGTERIALPLVSVIGASNEIPTADELLALYDRFLVRYRLEPVSAASFGALLDVSEPPTVHTQLSRKLVDKIRVEAARVRLSPGVRHTLATLRDWLKQKDIYVSDRRWLKIVQLLRVAAYTEGRTAVLWPDCWLIQHCAWSRPEHADLVRGWFDAHVLELVRAEPDRYARLVASIEAHAATPAARLLHKRDAAGRLLYYGENGSIVTRATGRRSLASPDGEQLYARLGETSHGDASRGLTAQQVFDHYFRDDLDGFDEYISDPAHQLHTTIELEPVMQTLAGDEPVDRHRQLAELANDLGEHLRTLSGARAPEANPLWLPAKVASSLDAAMRESTAQLAISLDRLRQVSKGLRAAR